MRAPVPTRASTQRPLPPPPAKASAGGVASSGGAAPPAVDLLGGDLLGDDEPPAPAAPAPVAAPAAPAPAAAAPAAASLDDLLGGMDLGAPPAPMAAAAAATAPVAAAGAAAAADPFDLLGGDGGLGAPAAPAAAAAAGGGAVLPLLLAGDKGKGLTVRGGVVAGPRGPVYQLSLTNGSAAPLDGFMLQLNSNAFGLAPGDQAVAVGTLAPGASGSAGVPLAVSAAKLAPGPASGRLQVALKTAQLGVFYWDDALPLGAVLEEGGAIDGGTFLNSWRAAGAEASQWLDVAVGDVEAAKAKLGAARLFVLAQRPVPGTGQDALYVTGRAPGAAGPVQLLLELRLTQGVAGVDAAFKCARPELAPLVFEAVAKALA